MSKEYDEYISWHRECVRKAYYWLCEHIPEVCDESTGMLIENHDKSKYTKEEYDPYDAYFYDNYDKSRKAKENVEYEFDVAWLTHIHRNPHHWQHWVLMRDDPVDGRIVMVRMAIPQMYLIEMFCDWWSFSFIAGDLDCIFVWYSTHKDIIIMNDKSKSFLENLMKRVYDILHKDDDNVEKAKGQPDYDFSVTNRDEYFTHLE